MLPSAPLPSHLPLSNSSVFHPSSLLLSRLVLPIELITNSSPHTQPTPAAGRAARIDCRSQPSTRAHPIQPLKRDRPIRAIRPHSRLPTLPAISALTSLLPHLASSHSVFHPSA